MAHGVAVCLHLGALFLLYMNTSALIHDDVGNFIILLINDTALLLVTSRFMTATPDLAFYLLNKSFACQSLEAQQGALWHHGGRTLHARVAALASWLMACRKYGGKVSIAGRPSDSCYIQALCSSPSHTLWLLCGCTAPLQCCRSSMVGTELRSLHSHLP